MSEYFRQRRAKCGNEILLKPYSWISTHTLRSSLTKFSLLKNVQTQFLAPQNPSTNTCLAKLRPDTICCPICSSN